jgi:predicted pyridoxine 5'-phosphate oxidase superfamily flavin-nucleotide-binding protein
MTAVLSPEAKQLIDRPNFAHLATLMTDGSPQSVPVCVGREGNPEARVALIIEATKARYTKLPFEHTPPK